MGGAYTPEERPGGNEVGIESERVFVTIGGLVPRAEDDGVAPPEGGKGP